MIPAYSGQIPVCLQCGGREIRPQGIREGLWPGGGEGMAWVCDDCGHIGQPLLVDPEDRRPTRQDKAWEEEYEATAKNLDRPRAAPENAGRSTRNLGILFLVLAAIFFLPPIMLLTNAIMIGQPDMIGAVMGQSWLFLGIGTVALVLGVRKVEHAARLDEQTPRSRSPLAELQEAAEQDQSGRP